MKDDVGKREGMEEGKAQHEVYSEIKVWRRESVGSVRLRGRKALGREREVVQGKRTTITLSYPRSSSPAGVVLERRERLYIALGISRLYFYLCI